MKKKEVKKAQKMKSDKKIKMAIMVTAIIALSMFLMIVTPVSAINGLPPEPEELWNYPTNYDVTDIALGALDGNPGVDVAAIDRYSADTIHAISGFGAGTWNWTNVSIGGFAIGVGDINDDNENEVIAGGYNNDFGTWGITAYDKDGNFLWFYSTVDAVTDIEIGDIDGDDIDDVVACNDIVGGIIYAINGAGNDLPGEWPVAIAWEEFVDVAIGHLDGEDGMDVAAIGTTITPPCLYVFNSTGGEMWHNDSISGRTVEIGDVNNDSYNEVVAGTFDGWVRAFKGDDGTLLYSFETDGTVMDIELGDLGGNPADVEVAAITNITGDGTLYAIDIDNTPDQEMWRYYISWDTQYYGESLAIGDIDRDYKNEVVAGNSVVPHRVWAFDGLDNDGDGLGDLVWSPYLVPGKVTDVEVGDLDDDGDDDVVFGTEGGETIYALAKVENKNETTTGTGTVYFDSDPSTLENLTAVNELELPEEGKPNLVFPHGFFSFNITGLEDGQTAIVTITFPENIPIGAQYWKYGPNGSTNNPQPERWYQIPIGDDDGDRVITIQLTDGGIGDDDGNATNGIIVDQGGIGNPRARVPALTPIGLIALVGLLALVATSTILRKRKKR